jgi:hypothetical protein
VYVLVRHAQPQWLSGVIANVRTTVGSIGDTAAQMLLVEADHCKSTDRWTHQTSAPDSVSRNVCHCYNQEQEIHSVCSCHGSTRCMIERSMIDRIGISWLCRQYLLPSDRYSAVALPDSKLCKNVVQVTSMLRQYYCASRSQALGRRD